MPSPSPQWTALVLAGQRPGIDALAHHFGQEFKARVGIAGKPMLARVLDTLRAAPGIGGIVVLAQDPRVLDGIDAQRVTFVASNAGISSSIRAVAGGEAAPWPVMVTTGDHPLLSPDMVSTFLAQAQGCDLAVAMVERAVLLRDYPENRRTWLKFRDGWWSGANLFALNTPACAAALDLWAGAEQDRKQAWKLFRHFGPGLALRALTRSIGLSDGLARAGRRLGLEARLVALPFAEAAIDVDKPADHALAEAILKAREQGLKAEFMSGGQCEDRAN